VGGDDDRIETRGVSRAREEDGELETRGGCGTGGNVEEGRAAVAARGTTLGCASNACCTTAADSARVGLEI